MDTKQKLEKRITQDYEVHIKAKPAAIWKFLLGIEKNYHEVYFSTILTNR